MALFQQVPGMVRVKVTWAIAMESRGRNNGNAILTLVYKKVSFLTITCLPRALFLWWTVSHSAFKVLRPQLSWQTLMWVNEEWEWIFYFCRKYPGIQELARSLRDALYILLRHHSPVKELSRGIICSKWASIAPHRHVWISLNLLCVHLQSIWMDGSSTSFSRIKLEDCSP